ncbi:MAG: hypothetical protein AAFW46_19760, partial [Pseudomonadota bacterium]
LDFRQQQQSVDQAIALFSGEHKEQAKEIWLVDPAPAVIDKLEEAVTQLDEFMQSQGLTCAPEEVPNLKGDAARSQFVNLFKEVQRFKTQLDQYTDLKRDTLQHQDDVVVDDLDIVDLQDRRRRIGGRACRRRSLERSGRHA